MNGDPDELKRTSLLRLGSAVGLYVLIVLGTVYLVPEPYRFWAGLGLLTAGTLHGLYCLGTVVKFSRDRSAESFTPRVGGNEKRALSSVIEGLMIRLGEGLVGFAAGIILLVIVW